MLNSNNKASWSFLKDISFLSHEGCHVSLYSDMNERRAHIGDACKSFSTMRRMEVEHSVSPRSLTKPVWSTITQAYREPMQTWEKVAFQRNKSRCVYSTLSIRQAEDNFGKFLGQDISNLFGSIHRFLVNGASSLWAYTPNSSEGLSAAITICLSQAWTLRRKRGKPTLSTVS